jgi:glycosyltransferase involved in cell wall biosynthesis
VTSHDLIVVVPFFNEERSLGATLKALAQQVDKDFTLVVVNNGSTDGSVAIAKAFRRQSPTPPVHIVHESQKGTGAASDTGFRFAIESGARWIARTDADCLPKADWTQKLRQALDNDGLEFVAGKILPRVDEAPLSGLGRVTVRVALWLAENYGKIHRRGPQFRYPYFMAAGNNLAISADLYVKSGGFPRSTLLELNEDRALSEMVRTLTDKAERRSDVIVYNSARRLRAYGVVNTLRWYRNRGYRPDVVDIR